MQIFPFKSLIPDLTKTTFDDDFYQAMREDFNTVLKKQLFKPAGPDAPGYYVLEIKSPGLKSTGLICLTSIDDYLKHRILRHEQTIAQKERLHQKLLLSRQAMIKPAALLIEYNQALHTILAHVKKSRPLLRVQFPDAQTSQSVWMIKDDTTVKSITRLFSVRVKHALIADGHHRFASHAALHTSRTPQQLLTVYFTPDEMQVSTFYRIITPLKSQSVTSILSKLQALGIDWKETKTVQPRQDRLQLIHRNKIYQFKLDQKTKDPIPILFSKTVTQSIFKINDETRSKRIKYLEYTDTFHELEAIMQDDEFVFVLPALTTQQVLHTKKILPPKSTLFTPRIINGLIIAVKAMQ